MRSSRLWLVPLVCLVGLTACNDMDTEPKFKPLAPSEFFADGRSARVPPADTVAENDLRLDDHLYTGKVNGKDVTTFPFPITKEILERGHERFDIFCSVCHGRLGNGHGMIVQRGFPPPPSYHIDRLRDAPVGHFFDVISNGYGVMFSYGDRIPVNDRWAIIAYIRALQLSQNATLADVTPQARETLEKTRS